MGHVFGEIEESIFRPTRGKESEKDPEEWEKEIRKAGIGSAYILSDGSLLKSGNVGGGAFIVGSRGGEDGREHEVECGIGDVATVWDSEVAGMAGALSRTRTMQERKILILADSKAAIATVKKADKTGKARTRHLQRTVNMIAEVKKEGGEVKIGWVKVHMGILRNEAADVLTTKGCGGGATG